MSIVIDDTKYTTSDVNCPLMSIRIDDQTTSGIGLLKAGC